MPDTAGIYRAWVHQQFDPLFANWEPTNLIRLGDYGTLKHGQFSRLGNIREDFRIGFRVRPRPSEPVRRTHVSGSSQNATTVCFVGRGSGRASGEAQVAARVEIGFSQADAVFLNAAGCVERSIESPHSLGRSLKRQVNDLANPWDVRWRVVTKIVDSRWAAIVMSGAGNAAVTLEAKADVPNVDLADANVGLMIRSETKIAKSYVSDQGAVVLFGCHHLASSLFGPTEIAPSHLLGEGDDEAAVQERLVELRRRGPVELRRFRLTLVEPRATGRPSRG